MLGLTVPALAVVWSLVRGESAAEWRPQSGAPLSVREDGSPAARLIAWRDDDDDDEHHHHRRIDISIFGGVRREHDDEDRDVDVDVDVDLGAPAAVDAFYDDLAPYGEWVDVAQYGTVWTPYDVPPDWRPYTAGHWVYTDEYGWTWDSDYEWGWAPFHYGRWVFDDDYGWVWVPGTRWAPAWVAWREGDDYVGWAPLPPRVRSVRDIDVNFDLAIGPYAWSFVRETDLIQPHLYERVSYPYRNVTLLSTTRPITSYTVVNRRIVNRGLPIETIERRAGVRVPKYQIAEVRSPAERRTIGRDTVAVVRPDFNRVERRTTVERRTRLSSDDARRAEVRPEPSREVIRRQDDDLRQLQRRHELQQKEFEDGFHQQLKSTRNSATVQRLRSQQDAERRALTDQQTRERRLMERQNDRERHGQVHAPRPDARRYRVETTDRSRSDERIEKRRKEKKEKD
jgi:hypothetical protein